jgi:hypothetical protein
MIGCLIVIKFKNWYIKFHSKLFLTTNMYIENEIGCIFYIKNQNPPFVVNIYK